METVKVILSWIWENFFDIALIIVGASAFVTYLLQVRNERRTAAALIIEQINSIEKIIDDLKDTYLHNNNTLSDDAVYLSREIIFDGAWATYKHLMIKQLSNSEFELLQKFFNSAYQIEKTKSDILFCFKLGWEHKSMVHQFINGKFHDPTFSLPNTYTGMEKGSDELIQLFIAANQSTTAFNPNIAYRGLYAELNNYSPISGTTAYNKLLKLAKRK